MNKLSVLKLKIYTTRPHIVCLTETWIKDGYEPTFVNYTSYFINRQDRAGGGIAILVRRDVPHTRKILTNYNGTLEIQAMTIVCDKKKIDIVNLYNPVTSITER